MPTLHPLLVMDYAFSYLGGAQTAVVQQALALARAGHAVTVAAPDATSCAELQGTGIALHDVPPSCPFPLLGLPLVRAGAATRVRLERLMDAAGTDLVLTHSEHGLAAAALRVGRGRGIPTMHTVHTFFLRGPEWAGFLAPVARGMHRAFTGLPDPRVRLAPRPLDSALRGMTVAIGREADLVLSPSAPPGRRAAPRGPRRRGGAVEHELRRARTGRGAPGGRSAAARLGGAVRAREAARGDARRDGPRRRTRGSRRRAPRPGRRRAARGRARPGSPRTGASPRRRSPRCSAARTARSSPRSASTTSP
ncbi:glycosyltransferase family 4 protein [Clavibacter zhangzhiyongii]|uniref:glycosyltransferase family 4 protein n=1 Tax=Clavibacter zhangzhiyongii TaxID=2768071 RepID=UPI0039E1E518